MNGFSHKCGKFYIDHGAKNMSVGFWLCNQLKSIKY
jgi:hypothetical protein